MMQGKRDDAPPVFWQEQQDKAYALFIRGEEWARISPATGLLTLTPQDIPFESGSLVPPYVCPFVLAEAQLGVRRVDDVRDLDGTPDPEVRSASERDAKAEGDTRTPAQWVREYARRAAALLKERERAGDS